MNRFLSVLLSAIVALTLGCDTTSASEDPVNATRRLSGDLLECTVRNDLYCAATLFHYPSSTKGEVATERAFVVRSLTILQRSFGTVRACTAREGDEPQYVHVFVSAGTNDYWAHYPEAYQAKFLCRSSKFDQIFLDVYTTDAGGKAEIRALQYGLIATPEASDHVRAVASELATELNIGALGVSH
jgi:hypothetical protein